MAQNPKKLCAIRLFCHGDEENGHHACMDGHLTTADQSEIRKANLVSDTYGCGRPKMKNGQDVYKSVISC